MFYYPYFNDNVYAYRGYSFRKTVTKGPDGRYIYQINNEAIDAPVEKMSLTTIKKVKEYIDKMIESEESTPLSKEEKVDRLLDIFERINRIATPEQECHIKFDIVLKKRDTEQCLFFDIIDDTLIF